MGNVLAAWTVAAFATDVPLGDLFGVAVITDGVAAVAGRSGRTLHVVGWIVRSPPVCSGVWYVIGSPCFIADVPLGGEWIVVISYFGEVALLPLAAIDKCNLVLGKPCDGIGAEIRDDCIWVLTRIAHDVRHGCLLPAVIDVLVAFLTGLRANVMC